jgi:hypothetical protein
MARKGNNPENLKPFIKGQSGNLNGRPHKLPAINEVLAKVLNEAGSNGLTRAENIIRKMTIKAETDIRAAEMILDRAYGRPRQQVENINNYVSPYSNLSDVELMEMLNKYVKNYNQKFSANDIIN